MPAPLAGHDLAERRPGGVAAPGTDGAGDAELPHLKLPPGPPPARVGLRRSSSGETVLVSRP